MFSAQQRHFAEALSNLVLSNPFEAERTRQAERRLHDMVVQGVMSGVEFGDAKPVAGRPLVEPVVQAAHGLSRQLRDVIAEQPDAVTGEDYRLYTDIANTVLYFRFRDRLQRTFEAGRQRDGGRDEPETVDYFDEFDKEWRQFYDLPVSHPYPQRSAAHLFACFFQVRRAYSLIDAHIVGRSRAAARLRTDVWHSVFTFDFHRFGRMLFDRIHDVTTLITGPSGTGKELVARAIGLSRHIPFDPARRRFVEEFGGAFHPVHIAALAETLLESELFGHAKGAFTGATAAREGWFELCGPAHTVFLDEIGELTPSVQVKLLRVLQNRTFHRLGESRERQFAGKLVAATNRDMAEEMDAGRFRTDLYFRLCSDIVRTPSLREQLADDPGELDHLVRHVALRVVGDETEASLLARDVLAWIDTSLGRQYDWPGNFRELEQCVKNVLVRNEYTPLHRKGHGGASSLANAIQNGDMTLHDLTLRYCRHVYDRERSYAAAARTLGIDQRTVKRYVLEGESSDAKW